MRDRLLELIRDRLLELIQTITSTFIHLIVLVWYLYLSLSMELVFIPGEEVSSDLCP